MAEWGRLLDQATPYPTRHLAIADPNRSYTTQDIARVVAWAADVAGEAFGGKIHVGDVSGSTYGQAFPPHKTHRQGRQLDIGYTSDRFPSVVGVPMDYTVTKFLQLLAPYGVAVQVSRPQRQQFFENLAERDDLAGQAPSLIDDVDKITDPFFDEGREGHENRIHVMFPTGYGLVFDADGGDTAVQYRLPATPDDFGWTGPAEGYAFVRATLRNYLDAPELLQAGPSPMPGQPTLASRILAARAYEWFRYYKAPQWPTSLALACQTPTGAACQFYAAAARYMLMHEDFG